MPTLHSSSYDDAPSRRMAWDDDGSVGFGFVVSNPVAEMSAAERADMNDEDNTPSYQPQSTNSNWYYGVIFPELRDVYGVFTALANQGVTPTIGAFETSGDTTNGVGGTWDTEIADLTDNQTCYSLFRDGIEAAAETDVRGVRAEKTGGGNTVAICFHLYGEIAGGETPDRLLVVDNTDDLEFGEVLDYGDIPRGSAEDYELYLTNNSGSLTASSVALAAEALYLAADEWFTLKEAGGSFATTLNLSSSVGAGADSPVITLRRNTPDDEQLGLHVARIQVSATVA